MNPHDENIHAHSNEQFYDSFVDYYHLIFDDWDDECEYQGNRLSAVIKDNLEVTDPTIFDVTCGIGTQIIGLAKRGARVSGADISAAAVERAQREARARGLAIGIRVSDVLSVADQVNEPFDVVISCDNSLPHLLSDDQIKQALDQMYRCIRPGGLCIITMRDYENEPREGEVFKPYGVRKIGDETIALFQLWKFSGHIYDSYWYVIRNAAGDSEPRIQRFKSQSYAVSVQTVLGLMQQVGFTNVRRLDGAYFQPVLLGSR
jgi:2-polyprenyl-3-methyl-5-hydroxy-6-metoxy-1,4-benzoquinol methylase